MSPLVRFFSCLIRKKTKTRDMECKGIGAICGEAVVSVSRELDVLFDGAVGKFAVDPAIWWTTLSTPVASKWVKPVSRIVGRPADGFNAIAYRDLCALSPLLDTVVSPSPQSVVVAYKSLGDTSKASFWKLLDFISQAAAMHEGEKPTFSPSMDAIRDEIDRFKAKTGKSARPQLPPRASLPGPSASAAVAAAPTSPSGAAVKEKEEWSSVEHPDLTSVGGKEDEGSSQDSPPPPASPPPPPIMRQRPLDLTGVAVPERASVPVAMKTLWTKLTDLIAPPPPATSSSSSPSSSTSRGKKGIKKPVKSRLRSAMEKVEVGALTSAFRKYSTPALDDAAASGDLEAFIDLDWSVIFDVKNASTFRTKLEAVSLNETTSAQASELFSSMLSFAMVEEAIPAQMMSKIEDTTTGLLQKLKKGETTLQEIDLQSLGESVLKECTEEDTEVLGNNLAQLLPVLQRNFGGNLPGMPLP